MSRRLLEHLRRLDADAMDGDTPVGRSLRQGAAAVLAALVGAGLGLVAAFPISILAFHGDPRSLALIFVCPAVGAVGGVAVMTAWWRRSG